MDYKLLIIVYLMICILPVVPSPYRTRNRKGSAPTYDQKQTGDYNIQLHLKDFEVVALLSDGILGDFGDYDYNYDYADFTMKPTTKKPTTLNTQSTYSMISDHVHSTTTPATSTTVKITETTPEIKTTESTEVNSSTVNKQTFPRLETSSEQNQQNTTNGNLKEPVSTNEVPAQQEHLPVINKEQTMSEEVLPLTIHRKCANGFTRDKQGRCRRVRRPTPQFSFGISRLATLAQKLRHSSESNSTREGTK